MKKREIVFLLSAVLVLTGFTTIDDIKSSVTSKFSSITSSVDPKLVAQVPEERRGEFPKAEYAVKVAEEKAKLAAMKSELAATQKKYVDLEEDQANIDLKEAGLDYDIVKMGAIEAAGLGKKEDNDKVLTKLKLKKVNLQGDRIKTAGNMNTVKQQMSDLAEKITTQEEQVKGLTAEKAKPEQGGDAAAEGGKTPEEKTR